MRMIEVIPNPYIALDKDGVPQGVVGGGAPGVFLCARLDPVATRLTGKNRFYYPKAKDGKAARSAKIPLDATSLHSVMAGELLVANLDDARACGLTDEEFLEPAKALQKERAKALEYYRSVKGKDAKLADLPTEPTPEPKEGLPPETASAKLTPTVTLTKNTEG